MSYISFNELKSDLFQFSELNEKCEYFAHIKEIKNDEENLKIEKECLNDHIEKVNHYFLKSIEIHGLESVIDRHIEKIKKVFEDEVSAVRFLKLLFFETVNFHDLGKINPKFQVEKMKNDNFEEIGSSLGSNHSILSVYLFYSYMVNRLEDFFSSDSDRAIAFVLILLFSLVIRKHHSSELTNPFYYFEYISDYNKNRFFENVKIDDMMVFLDKVQITPDETLHKNIFEGDLSKNLETFYKNAFINEILDELDSFPLYSLLKLNSSLLTISDYLATTQFMINKDEEINIQGIFNDNLREKVARNFYDSTSWNKRLIDEKAKQPKSFDELYEKNNSNLNELRYKMLYEVRKTLLEDIDKNLFFLEAPTGGGKTNISFMAITELLNKRKELNKVFYVFPFTTLVTQTKVSMKETFGFSEEDYIELHSRAEFKDNEDNYGKEWKNFLDYQFVNYPVTLLTHVRFFDIVKSNRKEDNYLYHKLANSIVIIDEIQAYSPAHWDKVYYFITNIAELFNTVFIIMSATLPKIDKIELPSKISFSNFVHLNKNKDNYFKNPNFSQRVEFSFIDIKDEKGEKRLSVLKDKIITEANNFNPEKHWILVEFIYKKTASDFFEIIGKDNYFKSYKKYLLSGTILEPVRKRIINELKDNRKKEGYEKVILVSTQVVEAGVDLDFDVGFKDTSIIDSDEQLAGRINRNASKDNCKVFLFDYDQEYRIYGKDFRYKVQKQKIDFEEYKKYLMNKDFDGFYKNVLNYINELNKSESRYGFRDYEDAVRKLNFAGVHNEFKLIDQDTISVFVNVEFDLNKYEIPLKESFKELLENDVLSGSNVWEKFCEIIENREKDFQDRKIDLIGIQSLMSNFIFSVFNNSSLVSELKKYGKEEYGFLVIDGIKEIYSLESGLNEKKLKEVAAWII